MLLHKLGVHEHIPNRLIVDEARVHPEGNRQFVLQGLHEIVELTIVKMGQLLFVILVELWVANLILAELVGLNLLGLTFLFFHLPLLLPFSFLLPDFAVATAAVVALFLWVLLVFHLD